MSSFCYSHFSSQNISVYAIFNDQGFNDTLTTSLVLNNWALGSITVDVEVVASDCDVSIK